MKIIFVRHGDPDYENDTVTETGKKESRLLKERILSLNADEFYVSPLGRAADTAKYALEGTGINAWPLDMLEEFPAIVEDLADNGGRLWDLMPSYWTKDDRYYNEKEWFNTPLMSSGAVKETYEARCKSFDKFLSEHGYERSGRMYKAVKPNKKTVVMFCHFGIECVYLSHLLGLAPHILWQGFVAAPSSLTTVVTEEREEGNAVFRCTAFGDISHLYSAGQTPSRSARFCEVYTDFNERH